MCCNETTLKISYPKRQLEPDDAFPLEALRSSSLPLCGDTQIIKEQVRDRLVTSLQIGMTCIDLQKNTEYKNLY